MTNYITADGLRNYMGDSSSVDEGPIEAACTAASRRIDAICGRYFTQDSTTSDKFFSPESWWACDFLDDAGQRWDLSTTTGFAVHTDMAYSGAYATTLTLNTDFFLEPINGSKFGQSGWPYTRMVTLANAGANFPIPTPGYKSPVKVTGKWGWAAVPADVIQACYVLAASIYKRKDAPFGVAGFDQFGSIRVRDDPLVMTLLEPFVFTSRWVA